MPISNRIDPLVWAANSRIFSELEQANKIVRTGHEYTKKCMLDRNRYMVDHAGILLPVTPSSAKVLICSARTSFSMVQSGEARILFQVSFLHWYMLQHHVSLYEKQKCLGSKLPYFFGILRRGQITNTEIRPLNHIWNNVQTDYWFSFLYIWCPWYLCR